MRCDGREIAHRLVVALIDPPCPLVGVRLEEDIGADDLQLGRRVQASGDGGIRLGPRGGKIGGIRS